MWRDEWLSRDEARQPDRPSSHAEQECGRRASRPPPELQARVPSLWDRKAPHRPIAIVRRDLQQATPPDPGSSPPPPAAFRHPTECAMTAYSPIAASTSAIPAKIGATVAYLPNSLCSVSMKSRSKAM